jgi:hypothetical protein
MAYELPVKIFNAGEHAKNRVIRANQFQNDIITQFKESYYDFWGVTSPPTGSRYTVEEMQAILDVAPTTFIDILTDAAQFCSYIAGTYPDSIESKYLTAAFDYNIGETGIILSSLKPEWLAPVKE